MASCYKYIPNGDKLMKNVITKKKKGFDNEHEYLQYLSDKNCSKVECHLKTESFHDYLHKLKCCFYITPFSM